MSKAKSELKVKIEPTALNIVITKLEEDEETAGGIIMPATAQRGVFEVGVVVAAGKGAWQFGQFIENPINVGDHVIYDARGLQEFLLGREKFFFLENIAIKGVIAKK